MLPEAPDRKYARRMRKEKAPFWQKQKKNKKKNPFSFSSDRWVENTYIFLATSGKPRVRFMRHAREPFHQ